MPVEAEAGDDRASLAASSQGNSQAMSTLLASLLLSSLSFKKASDRFIAGRGVRWRLFAIWSSRDVSLCDWPPVKGPQ